MTLLKTLAATALVAGFAVPVVAQMATPTPKTFVMKAGASDFIEKPFEKAALISCIEAAHRQSIAARGASARAQEAQARLNVLTDRERDVLNGLVDGLPNKSIAYDLGISPRTVEIHRANLMQKLEVKSLAEALRIAFHAGEGMEATGG